MERFVMAIDFIFGCRHRNLSRVFTLGGQTYRVCLDCGARFRYSLADMSLEHRVSPPAIAPLQQAQIPRC